MDINIGGDGKGNGGEFKGKIIFELYIEKTARTAENFRCLCTGERGLTKCGKPLHFLNSNFHRIMPGFMA